MFENINTLWIEILVILMVVTFIATLLGRYIYKRKHNIPTGECAMCHKSKNQLLKEYHKQYCSNKECKCDK